MATELTPVSQRATHALHIGDFEAANALLETARGLLGSLVDAEPPQRWNIRGYGQSANAVEAFVTAECLRGVLTTGKLLGRAEFSMLEDSEYVGTNFCGPSMHACMHVCMYFCRPSPLILLCCHHARGEDDPIQAIVFVFCVCFRVSSLLIDCRRPRCCDRVCERPRCGQRTDSLHGKRGDLQVPWGSDVNVPGTRAVRRGPSDSWPRRVGLAVQGTGRCRPRQTHRIRFS